MASNPNNPNCKKKKIPSSQPLKLCKFPKISADDDDFQDPSPSSSFLNSKTTLTQNPFKPSNGSIPRPPKKLKIRQRVINPGEENNWGSSNPPGPSVAQEDNKTSKKFALDLLDGGLDSIESTIDCEANGNFGINEGKNEMGLEENGKVECFFNSIRSTLDCEANGKFGINEGEKEMGLDQNGKGECFFNSMESRLVESGGNSYDGEFEGGTTQLDVLLKLCDADEEVEGCGKVSNCSGGVHFREDDSCFGEEEVEDGLICCPLCGNDISELSDELRQVHTNDCLDKVGTASEVSDLVSSCFDLSLS